MGLGTVKTTFSVMFRMGHFVEHLFVGQFTFELFSLRPFDASNFFVINLSNALLKTADYWEIKVAITL